jgi:photosystem II stability/assembly factor-like uncharacterized protein
MSLFKSSIRKVLFSGVVALLPVPVLAVQDVLETPAFPTEIAHTALLIDVQKVGTRLVAVGERGHIIFSDDLGKTWRQASVPVSVLLTAVHFVDESRGWAVGHGGVILHSSDGGVSWKKQFDGNAAGKTVLSQAKALVDDLKRRLDRAAENEVEDLEYQLEDATIAYEDAKTDAAVGASKPFLDVLFFNPSEGIAVGSYGFLFKTRDGGKTWTNRAASMDNPDRFHLNAIAQLNGGSLVAVGEAGVIFRSDDRGESWDMVESPYEGSFFGVSGTGEKGVALAAGLRGHLFRSEDGGRTWSQLSTGTESTLVSIDVGQNGLVTVVGASGTVLLSRDGGRTFRESVREDRVGNSSVAYLDRQRMVIVGERGVILAGPNGENI